MTRNAKGYPARSPAIAGVVSALCAAVGLQIVFSCPALANEPPKCSASRDAICGVTNVEDLVAIDGTPWVVGSSLGGGTGKTEPLYLFDTRTFTASPVLPSDFTAQQDRTTYPDCPATPDFTKFGSHGLDFRGTRGGGTLYVVSHTGRDSVEVFSVSTPSTDKPKFQWIGCVISPPTAWPDGITALPDGGFVATSLWDPNDKHFLDKLSHGQPEGGLIEWHPKAGWTEIGPTGISGPNGVVSSSDGKTLYVNLWGERKVLKYNRETKASQTVGIDLAADNVRWSQDRSYILVGGQDDSVKSILDCFESKQINCIVPFKVYKLDPTSMKLTELVSSGVYDMMGAGTGALQVGPDLWATSFRSDRIVRFPGLLAK